MCVLNLQTLYIRNLHDVLLLVLTENLPSDQINFLINYFFFAFFLRTHGIRPERENLPLIRYGNHESRREQIQVWFTIHLFYLDAIMHPSCISGNSYMGGLCREGGSLIIRGTTRKVAEWRGDFSRFVPLLTHVQLHNSIVISIRMPFSRRAFRFIPSAKGSAMGRRSSL